jgi:hypothetical protein
MSDPNPAASDRPAELISARGLLVVYALLLALIACVALIVGAVQDRIGPQNQRPSTVQQSTASHHR